jgi:hypothetical protein
MLGAPYDRLDDCPEHHRILREHAEELAAAAGGSRTQRPGRSRRPVGSAPS